MTNTAMSNKVPAQDYIAMVKGRVISDNESYYGSNKRPLLDTNMDVEAGYEGPRKSHRNKLTSWPKDDESVGLARGILVMVIVARTALMIPRPGSAALAAAEIAARMKGWDNTTATLLHALFAFFFTEVLLGAFLVYHATRLHARNVFLVLSMCFLWSVIAFNSQPEVIAHWRRVDEEQHAMNILLSVVKNASRPLTRR